jgi:hypothetical protein
MSQYATKEEYQASQNNKPVVHFLNEATFEDNWMGTGCKVAHCVVIDHPRLGQSDVRTSAVIKINEDGSFETRNSIYQPIQQLNG